MFFNIRVFVWSLIAELEYILYPWKEENPPPESISQKYNLPNSNFEENINYDWLKSHDEKIARLQKEMIWIQTVSYSGHTV